MKSVLLSRVSSQEQQEGHSIDAQVDRLKSYAVRKGFTDIKTFKIVESSTQGGRKEYQATIEYVKQQKECVALIADAVDRVQRSFKESIELEELRRAGKIELHFLREGIILNQDSRNYELMMWDFAVMGAKSYVLSLSENVKRTNEFRVRNGQWMGRAPVGYLNMRDPVTDKANIVIDKVRSYLVKKCFELYSTGAYSVRAVAQSMRKEGLTNPTSGKPLSLNQIDNLLKNPFYYGVMCVKKKLYAHQYQPIIDESLYLKCQRVRDSWNKKPFKYAAKPFVFRGLVSCAHCGRRICFDQKKGKDYIYGFCTKYKTQCQAERITEKLLLDQVSDLFKKIEVPQTVLVDIQRKLQDSHNAKQIYHTESLANLEREYLTLQKKLDNLLDMRLELSITQDEYDKKARNFKERQLEIDILRKQYTVADKEFGITVTYLLNLASKAYELFESSKVDQKRRLINFVLSNLRLEGKKLLYDLKSPFNELLKCRENLEWLPRLGSNQ